MNYLAEILAFNRWREVNPLPASAIALWHELMAVCNKAGWQQVFTTPNGTLQAACGLSRREFDRARQILIENDRIKYKKSERVNQAGRYELLPFPIVQNVQQNVQQKVHRTYNGRDNKKDILFKQETETEKTLHRFPEFWAAYPKKKSREDAVKAWNKIKLDEALFVEIMAALELHKKSHDWTKDNGQFIPNAATWLNGKRWEDEIIEAQLPQNDYSRVKC
jgi:hypothetical protein